MRLVPILIAVLVSGLIYAFVFERDRLLALLPQTEAPSSESPATGADTGESAQPQTETMRVVVQRSKARDVDSAVIVRGRTEADRIVELRAETSGLVISQPLRKGAFVDQGDELCRLDPAARQATVQEARARLAEAKSRVPEAKARVEEARAQLEEAEINRNAAENLVTDGFASQTRVAATRAVVSSAQAAVQSATSGLEAARAGIESARAAVASAEKEIDRLSITAPFSGVLETDTAEIGSLLQPGALCATVLQLDPITLVGFVSEMQVARVEYDAPATARTTSGSEVKGTVSFLSRAADDTTRTFRVEVRVPNPDLGLRDGETAEIRISAEGKAAHLLPQSALTLNDEGTLGLRLVDAETRAQFVPVTVLRDTPNGVWLTGLPETADVIVIGQEYVSDGVPVRPVYQELGQ
ncbi:membrane fusion protein, multidrug efflux system [Roseovarius tolerans]|uniref:Membrane fusion protein, multidrug efflux system n=1 Tax=Roseovarius tolerans TaxID=74031 RepID=A0A1H8BKU2_9RHOB|nr:efflux RND transporter periplasmic adaptor subunit [Roseovarius tolerans]SEM83413.1 membrane fusion protein, multidrug efflux system [Roseovarius tolerans]